MFKDSVVKLKKKGSSFDLPPEMEKRIVDFLGEKEKNPEQPTTYKSFAEVDDIISPYKKQKDGKTKLSGYKNLNLKK